MLSKYFIRISILTLSAALSIGFLASVATARPRIPHRYPSLGKFRNTYYYVAPEALYSQDPRTAEVRDMRDEVLAVVSKRFKKAMDLEGTGLLEDGRVLNFAGKKQAEIRYRFSNSPLGEGVGTCQLRSFRTIAVDPRRIPIGSLVLIDETIGMRLPDGSRHDGLWRAEDVGSAIQRDRIDLFVGVGDQGKVLAAHGITHLKALTVRLVEPASPGSCVHHRHDP